MKPDPTTIIDYTHDEFQKGIQAIVNQVEASDFQADVVLGIVRGGAIPAVYLSHKLKIPVQMLQWSLRDGNCDVRECEHIAQQIKIGLKVLVVDDIIDGGETIHTLLQRLEKVCGIDLYDQVKVAAMWYNPSQTLTEVDFFHQEIDRDLDSRWIVFEWE